MNIGEPAVRSYECSSQPSYSNSDTQQTTGLWRENHMIFPEFCFSEELFGAKLGVTWGGCGEKNYTMKGK